MDLQHSHYNNRKACDDKSDKNRKNVIKNSFTVRFVMTVYLLPILIEL